MAYGERAPAVSTPGGREAYFWGGMSVKARAYNAFSQGQFRDSDHELGAYDLNILLAVVQAIITQENTNYTCAKLVLRVNRAHL